ncbi:ATP synthase subunit d, mitochondrial [Nasonia vitripennis]|uniref:ATP synthase subunit d, mitochondrial n=1 Tax=Nasonia vitripennis TaxID=7425 RepID=A0A7M6UVL4_NASVI|nr:ATP synthase subunit d, mitochondrial [Nasonia vitripennis]
MATRRAIKAINWTALAERISEAERGTFAAFKAKSDQYLRRVNENSESAPKIDWAFYKSRIGIPGLVDKFQKEYESVKIDYPADKYTPLIEAQEKEALEAVQKFISDSNARIAENQKQIKKLEGMLKYSQMTMEDFRDAHPELAIDPLNNPTIFPHTPEYQPDPEGTEKPAAQH